MPMGAPKAHGVLRVPEGCVAISLSTDAAFVGALLAAPFLGQGKPASTQLSAGFGRPRLRTEPVEVTGPGPTVSLGPFRLALGFDSLLLAMTGERGTFGAMTNDNWCLCSWGLDKAGLAGYAQPSTESE